MHWILPGWIFFILSLFVWILLLNVCPFNWLSVHFAPHGRLRIILIHSKQNSICPPHLLFFLKHFYMLIIHVSYSYLYVLARIVIGFLDSLSEFDFNAIKSHPCKISGNFWKKKQQQKKKKNQLHHSYSDPEAKLNLNILDPERLGNIFLNI